jgi:hypothetical protein
MTRQQHALLQQLVDDYRRSPYVFPEDLLRKAVTLQARHIGPPTIPESELADFFAHMGTPPALPQYIAPAPPRADGIKSPRPAEQSGTAWGNVVVGAAAGAGAASVVNNVVSTVKNWLDIAKARRDASERRKGANDHT